MKKVEKLVRDGQVAILISPNYGAGWYTWNDSRKKWMLWHKELVEAIENKNFEKAKRVAKKANQEFSNGSDIYLGAIEELQIVWLPKGTLFKVSEYDGSEFIKKFSDEIYMEA